MEKYNNFYVQDLHHLKTISKYNTNYYRGIGTDLLYGLSDDDFTTEWFIIQGSSQPKYIGYSDVRSEPETINIQSERLT